MRGCQRSHRWWQATSPTAAEVFLRSPTVSLVNWPVGALSSAHYGASFLFFDYLATHYGTRDDLRTLVQEPLDGIPGIDAYLTRQGYDVTFRDVFKDWTVATLLDEPGDGRYSYIENEVRLRFKGRIGGADEVEASIPQFSAQYTVIDFDGTDIMVRFQGQRDVDLLPTSLGNGSCWWSNRGDSISSTLTRSVDLSGVNRATLMFRVWFDVEEQWDYGYLEVSTDQGDTWDILQAPGTSLENPLGNSFGPGYTGTSGDWLREEVDMSPYAGQEVFTALSLRY